jgi:spermidine synthase
MAWFFAFFLISGFCGILYELVWLRLAMAQFTVTTPFVSIVLSVFMGGLGLGSWGAGRWLEERGPGGALRLYGLTEFTIGLSAVLVPLELMWGRALMHSMGQALPTALYYAVAGTWIALALAPWCTAMGATYPVAMAAIRERCPGESRKSFSFLYVANLAGAILGSFVPLLFIEALGFRGTLWIGMALNFTLAVAAFGLSTRAPVAPAKGEEPTTSASEAPLDSSRLLWLLFATGITTMGVEVVWVRLYTVHLGTMVYAFAAILGTYLAATFAGSKIYRWMSGSRAVSGLWLLMLGLTTLLPLVACDPRRHLWVWVRLALGVVPFSAAAGFITPMLMDRLSQGHPARAGRGYAVNILGCVAGPLLAGFALLPLIGERYSLALFALPWLVVGAVWWKSESRKASVWMYAAAAAAVLLVFFTKGYEREYKTHQILRDHTATVMAAGTTREDKRLLVNGVGMTNLTPITKMMAHLPLAELGRTPESALVICFGMGTTHRSMLSWGIRSTAVELAPSVPRFFSWFHADAKQLEASPRSRIVIDDGRFFLERSREQFDVIVIDPPPPIEAAASSLLYSKEFYAAAKERLKPNGILAQWLPEGDAEVHAAVARALVESFPQVRVLGSLEEWGYHFLASRLPIPSETAATLAARLPAAAAADLVEWGPGETAEEQFQIVLDQEITAQKLIDGAPRTTAMRDDHPVNEYYLLRRGLK